MTVLLDLMVARLLAAASLRQCPSAVRRAGGPGHPAKEREQCRPPSLAPRGRAVESLAGEGKGRRCRPPAVPRLRGVVPGKRGGRGSPGRPSRRRRRA
ncbi:hypothetical protein ZWY2020_050448 [Hordeum vulgare]|nr:hypothetical protein ZWY2020_050448 [Hordeum vulgare]